MKKVKAAYSQMGKLGGMARAKQMAEQGFKAKPAADALNTSKEDKSVSKKADKDAKTTDP